jgi:hypothetical protein
MARVYFIIYILLLLGMIMINASERRSKTKADQIIRDICEKLYDDDLYSDENRKWYTLCEEWIKTKDPKQDEVLQDENIVDGKNIDYGDLTAYETCQQSNLTVYIVDFFKRETDKIFLCRMINQPFENLIVVFRTIYEINDSTT